ncbi:MAG TPA: tetratricopeptide repeat-containing serine/threonine-protein kinase [Longimicrobiales bacterium]|nr:tetratricopeptide repeat-containing serine/threonine-protein kinase [Longimicrobiales bacterium]
MSASSWFRLQSLFDAAIALAPPERESYLTSECGDDTDLRAQVDALIAASTEGGDWLASIVGHARRELPTAVAEGQRVGPWELVREIGHGGMGAVFLARRADGAFEAEAAVKLIGGIRTAEHLARFRAERQILAGLQHSNIARLLDGGSTPDDVPWVAMELVDGVPLDRYCDDQDLSVEARIGLFLDVCAAVAYAHRHLVVHRDIKPGNILVTADGVPKLLDFGIAKLLDDEASEPLVTRTGLRLLTPAYASPEQLRGERITIAADVYSLGVLLYRLLAGTLPYDVAGLSLLEVERRVCGTEPPRASAAARDPRTRRRLRGDLDAILGTALRTEPDRRYESVEAFAGDLRRHLDGRPVRAGGDAWSYRAGKFVQRHGVGVAIAAGIVLLVVGFTGALGVQNQRLATQRDAATIARASAEQVSAFLTDIFTRPDPARAQGQTVTARDLLDAGALRIEGELAGQPDLQAGLMRLMGDTYHSLGLQDQARPLLERALAQHRDLHGDRHPEVATTQLALASLLQTLGEYDAARPLFQEALDTRRQLLGPDHPDVGEAAGELGYLLETTSDLEGAEALFREALSIDRGAFPPDHPRVGNALLKLGRFLRQNGDMEEAEAMLREALAILRAAHGEDHPDVGDAARNLAALLRDTGEHAESNSLYQQVIAARRRAFGPMHPEVGVALNSYAILLDRMGEHERAIETLREFLAIAEHNYGTEHPDIPAGLHNVAWNLAALGRYDEARAEFRRVIALQDRLLAPDHAHRAHPRMGIADAYMSEGRFAEAEPWLREALELRRSLPPTHRYLAQTFGDLGACLTELGRWDEAADALLEARAILVATYPPDDNRHVRIRERLDDLAERSGRPELAVAEEPAG